MEVHLQLLIIKKLVVWDHLTEAEHNALDQ